MSTPVQNIQIIVKDANNNVVATLLSDANGEAIASLAPGKYKAEIAALAEYSFNEGTLLEPGQPPVELDSLNVLDIDVTSAQQTVCNIEYLED
jgi:hypothetical protein